MGLTAGRCRRRAIPAVTPGTTCTGTPPRGRTRWAGLLRRRGRKKGIAPLSRTIAIAALAQVHQARLGARLGHRMVASAAANEMALNLAGVRIKQGPRNRRVVDESASHCGSRRWA